jgi:ABC-2 type transport system permease protein
VTTPELTTTPVAQQGQQAPQVSPSPLTRARDLVVSEWIKLGSIRSSYLTLLVASLVTVGGTVVVAFSMTAGPHSALRGPVSALTASFLAYAEYAVLPVGVLGVLAFTSEYATGRIRITFTAVPQRRQVLAAKAAVAGAVAIVLGEALSFTTFGLTQALLAGQHLGLSLSQPGVPGAVLAAGVVLAVSALLGLGAGAITRHTAGAVAVLFGVLLLLAVVTVALPAPWNTRIGRLTPAFAAYQVTALHPAAGLFSPAWSMLILVAWPALMLAMAALVITRRDA